MENYKLQYVSDIHLENNLQAFSSILEPTAQDLALCGDIGDPYSKVYSDFLYWCSKKWRRVFLITGNHEYFVKVPDLNRTPEKIDIHIEELCKLLAPNLIFLQKSVYFIHESQIAIIGATLWTAPSIRNWHKLASGFLGDPGLRGEYNAIFKNDEHTNYLRPCHPTDITNIHLSHKAFIRKQLSPFDSSIPNGYRVIVLTHHLPSFALISPRYTNDPLRSTYASEQDDIIKEPVVAWLCGHSHDPLTVRYDSGTLVSLNPMGYNSQDKSRFSKKATIMVHRENIAIRYI
jgi:hypothetical protein